MTERMPPQVPYEDWIERRIRLAREQGAFDGLRGAGKPLPRRDRPLTGAEWAAAWARREGADLVAMLPLSLALRREREDLLAAVPHRRSEAQVRALVEDFNARLEAAYRRPADGPPLTLAPLDVEAAAQRWRDAHPAPVSPAAPVAAIPAGAAPHRRWARRLRTWLTG